MEDKYTQLREAYHDRVYARTNKLDGEFRNACEMYRRLYTGLLPADKGASIVDIACGPGQFLKFCLNNGYENITGVDLSPGQVRYAKDHVTSRVELDNGTDFLSRIHGTIDLIAANDFIEHLTKDRGIEFVGAVHHALKPGGRLILKTGNMASFGGLVIWCNGLDHECGYTEKSLRALLEIWGFQQVEIIPYYGRIRFRKWIQQAFFAVQRLIYRYVYAGDYPRIYTKVIAVTGVKAP